MYFIVHAAFVRIKLMMMIEKVIVSCALNTLFNLCCVTIVLTQRRATHPLCRSTSLICPWKNVHLSTRCRHVFAVLWSLTTS